MFFVFTTNFSHAQKFNFVEATIDDIHTALNSGEMTCRQIVSGYLDRITTFDQATKLNAITVVNSKALEKADRIDEKIQSGKPLGSLFCAPMLIKDNYDTHD